MNNFTNFVWWFEWTRKFWYVAIFTRLCVVCMRWKFVIWWLRSRGKNFYFTILMLHMEYGSLKCLLYGPFSQTIITSRIKRNKYRSMEVIKFVFLVGREFQRRISKCETLICWKLLYVYFYQKCVTKMLIETLINIFMF